VNPRVSGRVEELLLVAARGLAAQEDGLAGGLDAFDEPVDAFGGVGQAGGFVVETEGVEMVFADVDSDVQLGVVHCILLLVDASSRLMQLFELAQ